MLSVSMLLFCIAKLKLLSWNYVPDLQPHKAKALSRNKSYSVPQHIIQNDYQSKRHSRQ